MGIPKFYRWISERYPCLSEKIREYQIPEFDNLYLDMNGIIHNCSHPNDEDIHLRIPEKNIFHDIFRYIDFLLKMIKPRKAFFMAIDGVAPRAKMNQQRGRRFRSAKLAEDQEAEALRKGEVLPSEERFDSNCITPGTEFMARLHLQLKYFIKVKVSTDPLWQRKGLRIYLSGHDVPGEGEHKIMDYIRHIRSQPNYDPETRHCLYGLDADLIMLGLSTHELRFSLLREEVKFDRKRKPRKPNAAQTARSRTQLASYDLSNVSIFSSENGVGTEGSGPDLELLPAPLAVLMPGAKTFAEMAKMEPKPAAVSEKQKNLNKEVDLMPPLSHDEFAKGTYKPPMPEKTTFLLLHLSLLRDYIDEEFQGLRLALEGNPDLEYDLEKVLDDWILLSILVGNDFIPHLPKLHIVKGAFPMLYQMYAELLPSLGGYLNENGVLNLERFEKFLIRLSSFDLDTFRETYDDMKYMESKSGKTIVLGDKMFENFGFEEEEFEEEDIEPQSELQALVRRTNAEIFGASVNPDEGGLCQDAFNTSEDFFEPEDSPEFRLEFFQYKRNYYMEKMGIKDVTREVIQAQAEEYVRAVQWILFYYYRGVASWGWFYPGHYAPFTSDVRNFSKYEIQFDKGNPFKPFEQLLGVLPAQSRKFLPECFQGLMTDEKSPILEFYPNQFVNDLNGKKQDWEAVVLIPFIQEARLLGAMKDVVKLTPEEVHRNSLGTMHCISYNPIESGPITSPNDVFPAFPSSHYEESSIDEVGYDIVTLPKGLHPGAKKDQIYQGFPSLKFIPHTSCMERADIKIFEFPTREESMVLTIPTEIVRTQQLAKELLGKTVWVNWPHLTFALVSGVSDQYQKFIRQYDSRDAPVIKDESYNTQFHKTVSKSLIEKHMKFKGIRLNEVNVIVWAKSMEGRKFVCKSNGEVVTETQWSNYEQSYALQTTIHAADVTEIFYLDRIQHKSYKDIFLTGEKVFKLDNPYYGALGTVTSCGKGEVQVEVDCSIEDPEKNLGDALGRGALKSRDYYQSYEAAKKLGIPSFTLSRLTGTLFVLLDKTSGKRNGKRQKKKNTNAKAIKDSNNSALAKANTTPSDEDSNSSSSEEFQMNGKPRTEDIGLSLKFNKRNLEVRGYTRKVEGQWMYSTKAINLVKEYIRTFPKVLHFFKDGGGSSGSKDYYSASEIYRENANENVKLILDWLDERGIKDLARVPMNSNILDDDDVHDVWTHVLEKKSVNNTLPKKTKVMSLKPNLLHKPGLNRGCVAASTGDTRFAVLDRIVCVDPSAPVPLGQRGTIIGIQDPPEQAQQEEEAFRSTSSAVLKTLVILADPIQDVFDSLSSNNTLKSDETNDLKTDVPAKQEETKADTANLLSSALQSILRISKSDKPSTSFTLPSSSKEAAQPKRGKPTLVMLYPFQVLNLSENEKKLADNAVLRAHEEYSRKNAQARQSQPARDIKYNEPIQLAHLFPQRKERIELQKTPSSSLDKNLAQPALPIGIKTFAPTAILQRNSLQTNSTPSVQQSNGSSDQHNNAHSEEELRKLYPSAYLDPNTEEYLDAVLKENAECRAKHPYEHGDGPPPKLTNEERASQRKMNYIWNQLLKGNLDGTPRDFKEVERNYTPDLGEDEQYPMPSSIAEYRATKALEEAHNAKQKQTNVAVKLPTKPDQGQSSSQKQKTVPVPKQENVSANKNQGQLNQGQRPKNTVPAPPIQTQVFYRTPAPPNPGQNLVGSQQKPRPQQQPAQVFPVPLMGMAIPIMPQPVMFQQQTQGLMQMLGMTNPPPQPAYFIDPRAHHPFQHPVPMNSAYGHHAYQAPPPGPTPAQFQPLRSKGRGQRRVNNQFVPLQVDRASAGRPAQSAPARNSAQQSAVAGTAASGSGSGTVVGDPAPSVLFSGLAMPEPRAPGTEKTPPKNEARQKKSRIAANFGPLN